MHIESRRYNERLAGHLGLPMSFRGVASQRGVLTL